MLAELPYSLLQALKVHEDLKGVAFDLLLVDEYQDLNGDTRFHSSLSLEQ